MRVIMLITLFTVVYGFTAAILVFGTSSLVPNAPTHAERELQRCLWFTEDESCLSLIRPNGRDISGIEVDE